MQGFFEPFTAFLQKKALFRPVTLAADYTFSFEAPFEEHFLDTPDGARINLLRFPTAWAQRRGAVLYFHGNRGSLQRWGAMHADFTSRGFDFIAPDYRGYGKSKGKLSEDDPAGGQLTLEAGYLAVRDLLESVVGSHGQKYFPVVATFAVLILISNLMGQFPMFMSPTASVNVTYALGLSSFIYYNYVGIRENGVGKHVAHLAGPRLPWFLAVITGLIFCIELISNVFRPFTLGVRLFANMFSDEKVFVEITNIYPPYTHFLLPLALTGLGVFVAFVQTLVFSLLSMIYIGEVTHEPHDEHDHDAEHAEPAAARA